MMLECRPTIDQVTVGAEDLRLMLVDVFAEDLNSLAQVCFSTHVAQHLPSVAMLKPPRLSRLRSFWSSPRRCCVKPSEAVEHTSARCVKTVVLCHNPGSISMHYRYLR